MQIINVIDFNIIKAVCYTNTYVRRIGASRCALFITSLYFSL